MAIWRQIFFVREIARRYTNSKREFDFLFSVNDFNCYKYCFVVDFLLSGKISLINDMIINYG